MYRRNMYNILEKMIVFYSPGKLPPTFRKEQDTKTLFLELTEREFSFLIKTQETASACYCFKCIFSDRCKSGSLRKCIIHTVISPVWLYQLLAPLANLNTRYLTIKSCFHFAA